MKRGRTRLLVAVLAALALLLVGGYLLLGGGGSYSSDLNGLHARFNEDKGKVRLLVVLSPT